MKGGRGKEEGGRRKEEGGEETRGQRSKVRAAFWSAAACRRFGKREQTPARHTTHRPSRHHPFSFLLPPSPYPASCPVPSPVTASFFLPPSSFSALPRLCVKKISIRAEPAAAHPPRTCASAAVYPFAIRYPWLRNPAAGSSLFTLHYSLFTLHCSSSQTGRERLSRYALTAGSPSGIRQWPRPAGRPSNASPRTGVSTPA